MRKLDIFPVAVQQSVALLQLHQLLGPALHQLDDGQDRDGGQEVEHSRQPPGVTVEQSQSDVASLLP